MIAYIDVDDTLVRWAGTKRIPIPRVIQRVRDLHAQGATLYCWSTGGAEYARGVTIGLQIDHLFTAFLPKPELVIDDQPFEEWRGLSYERPLGEQISSVPKPDIDCFQAEDEMDALIAHWLEHDCAHGVETVVGRFLNLPNAEQLALSYLANLRMATAILKMLTYFRRGSNAPLPDWVYTLLWRALGHSDCSVRDQAVDLCEALETPQALELLRKATPTFKESYLIDYAEKVATQMEKALSCE